jgi:hypothetical protein
MIQPEWLFRSRTTQRLSSRRHVESLKTALAAARIADEKWPASFEASHLFPT